RLPWRDFERKLHQLDVAAHLHGVLHDAADIALHHHQILGAVAGRHRVFAPVAKPDLVHQYLGIERHGALDACEQHEGAHGLAIDPRIDFAVFGAALWPAFHYTPDRGRKPEPADGAPEFQC